jgi:hypothetical protein
MKTNIIMLALLIMISACSNDPQEVEEPCGEPYLTTIIDPLYGTEIYSGYEALEVFESKYIFITTHKDTFYHYEGYGYDLNNDVTIEPYSSAVVVIWEDNINWCLIGTIIVKFD